MVTVNWKDYNIDLNVKNEQGVFLTDARLVQSFIAHLVHSDMDEILKHTTVTREDSLV